MAEPDPSPRDPARRSQPGVVFRSSRVGGATAGPPVLVMWGIPLILVLLVALAWLPATDDDPSSRAPASVAPARAIASAGAASPGAPPRGPAAPVLVAGTVVEVAAGRVGPGLVGQRLYLVSGPAPMGDPVVPAFLVQHWGDLARGIDMDTTFAWVPAGDIAAGTRPVTVPCPPAVDSVLDIASLEPFERLVCFGRRTLTFGPTITSRLELGTRTSNRWLTEDAHSDVHTAFPFYDVPGISATVPDHVWLEVSGHFDDPSSASCGDPAEVTWCRERFVVTGIERVASPFLAVTGPAG